MGFMGRIFASLCFFSLREMHPLWKNNGKSPCNIHEKITCFLFINDQDTEGINIFHLFIQYPESNIQYLIFMKRSKDL